MSSRITIVHYFNETVQKALHFDTDEIILGRQPGSSVDSVDIDLTQDNKVSRRHARVYRHISTWWVEDLDSKNGTKRNNKPVIKATQLEPGDWLGLGDTVLQVNFEVTQENIGQGFVEVCHTVDETDVSSDITSDQSLEVLAIISQISATSSGQVLLDNYLRELFVWYPQGERCSIVLVEDTELITRAFGPGLQAKVSYSLARKAIESREAFRWTRAIDFSSNLKKHSSLNDVASAIYAPMICANEVIGALHIDSTITEDVFNKKDVAFLSLLANTMAPAIMQSRASSLHRLHNVFVSYVDEDWEFVAHIAKHLRKRAIKVWFNERIQFGDNRQDLTKTAIRTTDVYVLIVPSAAISWEQISRELRIAHRYGKKVIPIIRQGMANQLPKEIEDIQPIYISEEIYHSAIKQLADCIKDLPFSEQNLLLKPIRILFLAANPRDDIRLRTGEEYRTIKERLQSVEFRERFKIEVEFAVRDSDLSTALLRYEPDIVHFSGHGDSEGNIILEDNFGVSHPISPNALRKLFSIHKNHVRCVVLNTCFSVIPVEAIRQEIECAIGMSQPITDKAAIGFSKGFYEAIGYGRDIQTAFQAGCVEIELTLHEQGDTPRLFTKEGVSAKEIVFSN